MIVDFLYHLFYRIYWWNIKVIKDSGTPIYMTFLGTIFLFVMNINSLFFTFCLIKYGSTSQLPGFIYWINISVVILTNILIYFRRKKYKYLTTKYIKSLNERQIKSRDLAVIVYFILSFFIYFIIIVMVDNANNG